MTSGADVSAGSPVDALVPYLPRLLFEWMAEYPSARHIEVDGTVAFVDISGFTKLSERLARQGKVGAEYLSEAISHCFTELLSVAREEGGQLIKFGGDALLLLFTHDDHQIRGCRAAFNMRRALRVVGRLDVAGARVNLRMSVGVHSGTFNLFLVGQTHRELIITGPSATTTVRMESAAEAGEIMVSAATAAHLPGKALGEERGGGFLLKRDPSGQAVLDLTVFPSPDPTPGLLDCLSVTLRDHLLAPHHEPEHRRATVAFVHFDGTDELVQSHGPEVSADMLEELVSVAQAAAVRHGVAFLATDIDADGGKIILVAGVPTALGDDEEHMLRALRDIVDAGTAIPVRIGVNRGDVFAGDIGPALRRTYTVMGDTVNLAARLMAKAAPGQVFAAPSVTDRSRARFELTALEPFLVKGKALPVQAFSVGPLDSVPQAGAVAGAEPDGAAYVPLVGRQEQLDRLSSAMDGAAKGMGGLIEVVGDAGLGKTRLLRELRAYGESEVDGLTQLHLACEPYESSNPYSALKSWIDHILGIDGALGPRARADRVLRTLEAADAALVPWAPLFGVLIDVDLPDTPETTALEAKFRPAQLGEVTARLVAKATTQPLLVTIEDTHWMDDASAELLGHIAGGTDDAPLLICTTRRRDETGYRADPNSSIGLTPLSDVDAALLIRQASQAHPLSPHAAAALVGRAGGNPLYLTELAAAVGTSDVGSLPDSIEALITARIDRLPPQDRHTLRQASVLGRTFPLDWLEALVGRSASDIWDRLGAFLLIESEGIAGFEHALIRDAAYEGLPYRVRRELHAEVADIIRSSTEKGGENRSGLLSLHYLHAGRYAEAWFNARQAAGRAQDVYANLEAAELFERAIAAAGHLTELPAVELAGVHESLGDVRERFGAYAEAESSYKTARRLAGDDRLARARLHNKMALVQGWLDHYSQALGTLTRGIRVLDGDERPEANVMRARLSAAYAGLCQAEGHHRKAVKWCRRAIAAAEVSAEQEALANALRILDWSLAEMGGVESPDNVRRALSIYEELDDLPGQATSLNVLGTLAYWRGDWPEAAGYYERARRIAERTGNTMLVNVMGANIAEILLDQGRVQEAAELFAEASHLARAAHSRALAAFCECNLARALSRQGRYDEAIELFDGAIADAQAAGVRHESLESLARKAECLLISGKVTEALELADRTLELAQSLGGAPQAPLLHRVRAVAFDRLGDRAMATQGITASLDAARTRGAEYEVALSQLAEAAMIRRGGQEPPAGLELSSEEILERLGVLSTPALYG